MDAEDSLGFGACDSGFRAQLVASQKRHYIADLFLHDDRRIQLGSVEEMFAIPAGIRMQPCEAR